MYRIMLKKTRVESGPSPEAGSTERGLDKAVAATDPDIGQWKRSTKEGSRQSGSVFLKEFWIIHEL